jgi:hypothetical protein
VFATLTHNEFTPLDNALSPSATAPSIDATAEFPTEIDACPDARELLPNAIAEDADALELSPMAIEEVPLATCVFVVLLGIISTAPTPLRLPEGFPKTIVLNCRMIAFGISKSPLFIRSPHR